MTEQHKVYKKIDYIFNEPRLMREFQGYIDSTYGQHYAKKKIQAAEFIIDAGMGSGFCLGNVLKYAQRYGKKGTPEDHRKDLMKVLHYALIALHVHDEENKRSVSMEGFLKAAQKVTGYVGKDDPVVGAAEQSEVLRDVPTLGTESTTPWKATDEMHDWEGQQ